MNQLLKLGREKAEESLILSEKPLQTRINLKVVKPLMSHKKLGKVRKEKNETSQLMTSQLITKRQKHYKQM